MCAASAVKASYRAQFDQYCFDKRCLQDQRRLDPHRMHFAGTGVNQMLSDGTLLRACRDMIDESLRGTADCVHCEQLGAQYPDRLPVACLTAGLLRNMLSDARNEDDVHDWAGSLEAFVLAINDARAAARAVEDAAHARALRQQDSCHALAIERHRDADGHARLPVQVDLEDMEGAKRISVQEFHQNLDGVVEVWRSGARDGYTAGRSAVMLHTTDGRRRATVEDRALPDAPLWKYPRAKVWDAWHRLRDGDPESGMLAQRPRSLDALVGDPGRTMPRNVCLFNLLSARRTSIAAMLHVNRIQVVPWRSQPLQTARPAPGHVCLRPSGRRLQRPCAELDTPAALDDNLVDELMHVGSTCGCPYDAQLKRRCVPRGTPLGLPPRAATPRRWLSAPALAKTPSR